MGLLRLLTIGLFAVLSPLSSSHLFAQEDVVQKRKDFMNDNYAAWKAIKRAVEQKDYTTVELKAKDIMGSMDKVPDYFPKGSITRKSRAKAEIWEKWDEFNTHPLKVKDISGALAKAAAAKDDAGVQAQFKALGADSPFRSGPCYECHKSFFDNRPIKKADG